MAITTYELIPVHGLDETDLCEGANSFAEKAVTAFKSSLIAACQSGNCLNELKSRTPHGKWMAVLKSNFDYSHQTAATYMHLAANFKRLKFEELASIRDAVRYLEDLDASDEPAEPQITPRAERKTGRVEVVKADCQQAAQTDDNAVQSEPKTNTKHTEATAKAKEADKPVPAVVTPEIVDEPDVDPVDYWLSQSDLTDIVNRWMDVVAFDGTKAETAKRLRKIADAIDPPKEGKTPSRSQLVSMIPDDWATELQKAAADWAEYKQARAKGERIQTVRAWELALAKFTSQPVAAVVSKVNTAIEKSWKGWDHDTTNQQAGRAIAGTGRIRPDAIDESAITWK